MRAELLALVVGAKRKGRGEEDAKCRNGVEQHEIGCTTYLCDGCDTYTEDGDGETYTLDNLREQANNYMDAGNNGDEFDDLFDAMDKWFEELQSGAIAARASAIRLDCYPSPFTVPFWLS